MIKIRKMAELITGYLQKNGIIEQEKQEVYIYGLQQMGVEMINILSILLISIVCGQLVEAVVFVTAFRMLRSYAGGYHAKTQWRCYFLTVSTIILALSIIKYLIVSAKMSILLWGLSGVLIFLWVPIEAENKPLDQMEIRIYRKKAKQIWCMETICFLVSILGKWVPVYESILLAGICTSLSLVAANVKKLKVRK